MLLGDLYLSNVNQSIFSRKAKFTLDSIDTGASGRFSENHTAPHERYPRGAVEMRVAVLAGSL